MFGRLSASFRAGQRPFIPLVIKTTALQIWYNADKANTTNFNVAPTNGADISQWKDISGTGHSLNQSGNAAQKPQWYSNVLNGLGVVRFNGIGQGTTESLNINPISWMRSQTGFTMFVIAAARTTGSAQVVTTTDTSGFKVFHDGSYWGVAASGGSLLTTAPVTPGQFDILAFVYDGTQADNAGRLRFRHNREWEGGTYTGTVGTTTSSSSNYFYIGTNETNNGGYFQGDIAEVLMFTRTLTESELQNVENYITNHWGV